MWVVLVAACAPRDAGFSTVRSEVRQRVGHAPHYHDVEGAEDGETTQRVRALLAKPLDAEAAVQIALLRNPRLQAAFTRLGVARASLLGASLPPNPEFHVEMGIPEGEGSIHWSFGATQNLTDLLALPLARAQASALLERAQVQAAAEALDIAYGARRAFYEAQAAEQERALVRDVVTVAGLTRELITRLHDAGNITDLELAQSRAFEQNAQLMRDDAEQNVFEARVRLWQWLGGPETPAKIRVVEQLAEVPSELPALAELESRSIEQSLDLRLLDAERRSFEEQRSYARVRGILPELHAGVHAERDHGEWEIGPTAAISVPLFDHGQTAVESADASLRGLVYARQARELSIRGAAHALRARLERSAGTVRRYASELLPLQRTIVDQSLRQYNAMQIGVQSLLMARSSELDTNRAYVAALLRYWLLRADLDQLLAGRLVESTSAREDHASGAETAPSAPNGAEASGGGH